MVLSVTLSASSVVFGCNVFVYFRNCLVKAKISEYNDNVGNECKRYYGNDDNGRFGNRWCQYWFVNLPGIGSDNHANGIKCETPSEYRYRSVGVSPGEGAKDYPVKNFEHRYAGTDEAIGYREADELRGGNQEKPCDGKRRAMRKRRSAVIHPAFPTINAKATANMTRLHSEFAGMPPISPNVSMKPYTILKRRKHMNIW